MGNEVTRLFATLDGTPCSFGCTYCFSRFETYDGVPTLADLEANPRLLDGVDVLYPACDTDLFGRRDAVSLLRRYAQFGVSLSISTKARIPDRTIRSVAAVAESLVQDSALLKIGVSITAVSQLPRIEPHTPGYRHRLESLGRLAAAGVATALIMRPLLADVPLSELKTILIDASTHTSRVLLGDEWLDTVPREIDSGSSFGEDWQPVLWLPDRPTWQKREATGLSGQVAAFASTHGYEVFESDAALMRSLLERAPQWRAPRVVPWIG